MRKRSCGIQPAGGKGRACRERVGTFGVTALEFLRAAGIERAAAWNRVEARHGTFDLTQACDLIKRFDRPVMSLNPLADGKLSGKPEEAFSFLFDELKIYSAIAEIASEKEARVISGALEKFPSLISHQKT